MKILSKVILVILAILVAAIAIWLVIFAARLHSKTENKINTALESGFPDTNLSINERVEWQHLNQICFDVTVGGKPRAQVRRAFVMVNGDTDGGAWWLGPTRYHSMEECKKHFERG
ncbi:MAG: hypothetical protein PSY12_07030 [bacterium]|nr:hypothetical protein [bacterium]